MEPATNLTELLRRANAGDREAANEAFASVFGELRRAAQRLMRGQGQHTLDPDGLVNEAYLRVASGAAKEWENRGHFLAVMATAMRHYLIDHVRGRDAEKRGGGMRREPLTGIGVEYEDRTLDLLTLHEALEKFRAAYPESATVVELTYFLGLTANEVAESVDISPRTVVRELAFAKAWLRGELEP